MSTARYQVFFHPDAEMAGAREAVAREVAELKRRLDETDQRVAALTAERDKLAAEKDDMRRLPTIRPMTVTPPTLGNPPAE